MRHKCQMVGRHDMLVGQNWRPLDNHRLSLARIWNPILGLDPGPQMLVHMFHQNAYRCSSSNSCRKNMENPGFWPIYTIHHFFLLLIVRCVFVVFSYFGISRPKLWRFFFGLGGPLDHFLHVVVGDLRGFLQVVDDGAVATDHRIADAVDVTFADGKQQIWVGLMSWPRRMRIVTSDSLKFGRRYVIPMSPGGDAIQRICLRLVFQSWSRFRHDMCVPRGYYGPKIIHGYQS